MGTLQAQSHNQHLAEVDKAGCDSPHGEAVALEYGGYHTGIVSVSY